MTMANVHLKIIVVILLIGMVQIAWHALICLHDGFATMVLNAYLDHDPHSGKGISGFFDFTIPEAVLGYPVGRMGCRLPFRITCLYIMVSGLMLVGLMPVYVHILSWNHLNATWWPVDEREIWRRLAILFFEAELVLGFFSVAGRSHALGRAAETQKSQQ